MLSCVSPEANSRSVISLLGAIKGKFLWMALFLIEMIVASTWGLVSLGCLECSLPTKSSQRGSLIPRCHVPLPSIRSVMASEVGGTTTTAECIGFEAGISDCACDERMGFSKLTCKFVLGGARNYV